MSKVHPVKKTIGKGKGLFIGINYPGTSSALKGCINDSISLKYLFETQGFECELLTKNQTKAVIVNKIRELSRDSYQGVRNFIIQYSGHGTSLPDRNGDENDGKDEALVSSDMKAIIDDELFILFKDFHPSSIIFMIIDACHSGSIMDLSYCYKENGNKEKQNNNNLNGQKVFMISGCKDDQYSMDTYSNKRKQSCGALSNALIQCDFLNIPIFDLQRNIQSGLAWASQLPCLSSSFELENKSILENFN